MKTSDIVRFIASYNHLNPCIEGSSSSKWPCRPNESHLNYPFFYTVTILIENISLLIQVFLDLSCLPGKHHSTLWGDDIYGFKSFYQFTRNPYSLVTFLPAKRKNDLSCLPHFGLIYLSNMDTHLLKKEFHHLKS